MTIVYRQDSTGQEHQIWAQRQENSCAVAAIWMARQQARQMSIDESEWELAWRVYQHTVQGIDWGSASSAGAPTGPMTIDSSAYAGNQSSFYNMFGSAGTYAKQVAMALRSDGFAVSHSKNSGTAQQINLAKIGPTQPAIVLVGWYTTDQNGSNVRNGGHFVVAAGRAGTRVIYLDPWGGNLYEFPNNARYKRNGLIEEVIYLSAGL